LISSENSDIGASQLYNAFFGLGSQSPESIFFFQMPYLIN